MPDPFEVSERFGFSGDEWDLVTEIPLEIYLAMLNPSTATSMCRTIR